MRKERILIVDDDPDILDVLTLTLSGPYEVLAAQNGQEGLLLAQTKSPNLIISDYKMPVMDGRQFCQALKKDILLQHIPVIMLTGKGEIKDKVGGIDAGAEPVRRAIESRRLVVGGGRALAFPVLGQADISLNIDLVARPHVLVPFQKSFAT